MEVMEMKKNAHHLALLKVLKPLLKIIIKALIMMIFQKLILIVQYVHLKIQKKQQFFVINATNYFVKVVMTS